MFLSIWEFKTRKDRSWWVWTITWSQFDQTLSLGTDVPDLL